MMMDTQWGVGVVSAPPMPGFGPVGFPDHVMNSMCDDEIEGMIDGLGFFQENDDDAVTNKNDTKTTSSNITNHNDSPCQTSEESLDASEKPKHAVVSPPHVPIFTNDTGAVVSIPDLTISNHSQETKTINISTPITSSNTKNCGIALPQPPPLVLPLMGSAIDNEVSIDAVLEQQRKTILKNQQIIDAQKNELKERKQELQGRKHAPLSQSPVPVISVPVPNTALAKTSASYSLAHAALKKADEQIISINKTPKRGTKRKADASNSAQANAYQKWKLTPAAATKLKTVDLGGVASCRSTISKAQDDPSGKKLTPVELEVRRERNRKHAKKSRLRKKSLTTTLEQSLEVLRDENTKLRKRIEDHIAATKKGKPKEGMSEPAAQADTTSKPMSVDTLLDEYRLQLHEKFIADIRASSGRRKNKKKSSKKRAAAESGGNDSNHKKKSPVSAPGNTKDNTSPITGRGIVVDDATLKTLRGLSKSIVIPTATLSKKNQ